MINKIFNYLLTKYSIIYFFQNIYFSTSEKKMLIQKNIFFDTLFLMI